MDPIKNQTVLKFVESVGDFIEYWGFKNVHGRIWALAFLHPEPVDANYFKNSLGISKALTSMSIRELLEYDVLLEVKKSRPETQKYRANPDITQVIINVLKKRELKLLKEVNKNFHKVQKQKCPQVCPERATDLNNMIDTAETILTTMVGLGQVDFNEVGETFKNSDWNSH